MKPVPLKTFRSDNEGTSDKNGGNESENEFFTATESERENKKAK